MELETLSNEFSELIAAASGSIVLVQGRRHRASGIIWKKNLIVTADHSLPRSEEIEILTASGESAMSTVAGRDPSTDIALLKTEINLAPLEPSLDLLKSGQLVMILGRANRGREIAILTNISGKGEAYRNWRGGMLDQFIRLAASPFPGFSGSALVLPNGKVAGMNTSLFSSHFGLTVPASNVERLIQRLTVNGNIGRPYLGLAMQPVRIPDKLRAQAGADIGLLLVAVEEGSPAEHSGFLIGDILARLNQKALNSTDDVYHLLTADSIGKELRAGILRGGNFQELTVKIGERFPRKRNE